MIRESAPHWIRRAWREGWAVGMFNAHHLEAVQAVAAAAEARRAVVMLSTTMGGLKHVGLDYFVAMAAAARRSVSVPLILHLDHGADFDIVKRVIEAGFDSVMIDASATRYEDNVALVREVVALARRHGVGIEAQIGETLAEEGEEVIERKTTVEEAVRFVADTDVDYLAVSIGNTPGTLGDGAPIDVPLVRALAAAVERPLVLHGGTSVPPAVVREVVAAGIAKINIDAATKGAFRRVLQRHYGVDEPVVDTRLPMAEARSAAQEAVEERIVLFGADGKAD
ncbi:MAG: class II fructose-bisphosphate aldolase [Azospirillaceae bacterium]